MENITRSSLGNTAPSSIATISPFFRWLKDLQREGERKGGREGGREGGRGHLLGC